MWASFITGVVYFFWVVSAILLILVVLIQRGKGGGLSGAFGGVGGHSALGTKAADVVPPDGVWGVVYQFSSWAFLHHMGLVFVVLAVIMLIINREAA